MTLVAAAASRKDIQACPRASGVHTSATTGAVAEQREYRPRLSAETRGLSGRLLMYSVAHGVTSAIVYVDGASRSPLARCHALHVQ